MWRFALSALALAACLGPGEHRCADSAACGDNGVCVVETGYCAFASDTCCGLAYGAGAGPLAGACVDSIGCGQVDASFEVDGALTDAAPVDAPPPDAAPFAVAHLAADQAFPGTVNVIVSSDTVLNLDTGTPLPAGAGLTIVPQVGGGPDVVVLRASRFDVRPGVTLVVRGSRPLIVIATSMDIGGVIDVSASFETPGPGGALGGQGDGRGGDGVTQAPNSGGGGGAGFGTAGARGGDDISTADTRGGDGGAPYGDPSLAVLAGGSGGGAAEPECTGTLLGGGGGGALQLSASASIRISGGIDAGGGGGRAGRLCSVGESGRGGGSGGAVYLQASTILIDGFVTANGGGGGASSSTIQGPGTDGADGTTTTAPAPGGTLTGTPCGGAGGAASVDPRPGLSISTRDGCGGGGAVGRIVFDGANSATGVISPVPFVRSP